MGLNIFKSKKKKREEALLAMYEKGQYLRVDSDIDNKQLVLEGEVKKSPVEEPIEKIVEEPAVIVSEPSVNEVNDTPPEDITFDGSEDIFG